MSATNPVTPNLARLGRPCGAVLTGGASLRMGRDKALLELPDGRSMVEWVVERLARVCEPVLAIDPNPARLAGLQATLLADEIPRMGPLGGLVTALAACPGDHLFLAGCDMPLLDPRLITGLLARIGDHDVAVPVIAGRWQPLGALYSVRLREPARVLLANGPHGIHELLAASRVRRVDEVELRELDPELRSFTNLNAPADLMAIANELLP